MLHQEFLDSLNSSIHVNVNTKLSYPARVFLQPENDLLKFFEILTNLGFSDIVLFPPFSNDGMVSVVTLYAYYEKNKINSNYPFNEYFKIIHDSLINNHTESINFRFNDLVNDNPLYGNKEFSAIKSNIETTLRCLYNKSYKRKFTNQDIMLYLDEVDKVIPDLSIDEKHFYKNLYNFRFKCNKEFTDIELKIIRYGESFFLKFNTHNQKIFI